MRPRAADAALVVDLDGVLRIWDPEIVADAERRAGLPTGALDRAAFRRSHPAGRRHRPDQRRRVARGDRRTAGRRTRGGRGRSGGRLVGPLREVDERVLAVLREQRRSRPVALLSNATDRLPRDLQRLGLDDEFDAVFNSSALGLAKPDPEVFLAACSALGLPPDRCVLVDDQQVNVDAATRVGLRAHLYRGPGELAAVLQDGSG